MRYCSDIGDSGRWYEMLGVSNRWLQVVVDWWSLIMVRSDDRQRFFILDRCVMSSSRGGSSIHIIKLLVGNNIAGISDRQQWWCVIVWTQTGCSK